MLSHPARKFACQFVYRRTLGVICRTWNNRGPIFSPSAREPAIQKVAKYGMRDPYMLYKIWYPYFIKVHIYYGLLVPQKISRSRTGGHTCSYFQPDRLLARFIMYILHVMSNTYSILSLPLVESVCQFRARQPDNPRYILHVMCNTYSILSLSVDLYIMELWMLFGGHETIEVQCWAN